MTASFAINIALLVLGTIGALAAFGGETWRKGDEPLPKRVTRRGWIALTCMLAVLALGVAKEVRANASLAVAQARERELEQKLAKTLNDLQDTRAKLAEVEPNLLKALVVATTGLRRESDFATPSITGRRVQPLVSGRTGSPLLLYGGDFIEYHIFCTSGEHRIAQQQRAAAFVLRIGSTEYPLTESGRQMVIGPIGEEMPVVLLNLSQISGCQLKMLIESADRTREARQLEPLLRMIEEAKASNDFGSR